jgi:multidrug efflux pump subunit AcrA (membrane-fusion protein)
VTDFAPLVPAADLHARQAASGLTRHTLGEIAAAAAELDAARAAYETARAPLVARLVAWEHAQVAGRPAGAWAGWWDEAIAPTATLLGETEIVADVAGCARELYPVAKWRTVARRYRAAAKRLCATFATVA